MMVSCLSTAEQDCGGKYRIVSSTGNSEGGKEILVQCGAAATESSEDSESEPESRSVEAPLEPKRDPPTGAAGFSFGDTLESAAANCQKHSFEWSKATDASVCSGAPVSVGGDARVELRPCGAGLCRIDLVVSHSSTDEEAVFAATARFKRALVRRYGAPTHSDINVPKYCKGRLVTCLTESLARVSMQWRWGSGERIEFSLQPRDQGPTLVVSYQRGADATETEGL